jgi:ArsR family transcriptional regulator, arsenate/arsenite/antimonite-responsive transcriptional repressor / arsenate reductase (thioredoxin)
MTTTFETVQAPAVLQLLAHDLRWRLVSLLARGDYQVHELVQMIEQPTNLVSYHLKRLKTGELVRERRSSADGREIYYSLDLNRVRELYLTTGAAIHPGLSYASEPPAVALSEPASPARVLFLCTHNSARSQIAEGILRRLAGGRVEVFSAGSEPSSIHPEAVGVLTSFGIDPSQHHAKHLDQYRDQHFDYIITVCDRVRESCPVVPGDPERIHWSFPDPAAIKDEGQRRQAFDQTASQLMTRIRYLLILIDRENEA